LSRNPKSEYISADSGHWIMIEKPELVAEKLKQRIKSIQ
jgi:pimeloyl-ACP methyl ester carboxylesterase